MPKPLTALSIDKFKAADRRQEIPDGLITGLYLVIQPSGKRSWAVRYRNAGAPRKLTLGKYPAVSLADARAAAKTALVDVAIGVDPGAKKIAAQAEKFDQTRTFEAVARRYVEALKKKGNRTWREPARQLGLVPPARKRGEPAGDDVATFVLADGGLVARWKKRVLDSISTDELIVELDAQAPIQANRFLNTLRTLWKFALSPRLKLATANPLLGLERQTPETSRDRVLSDDELRRIWYAAEGLGQPWTALVRALMLTGQRRDEVAKLPWLELDIAERKWVIPAERAKNGEAHLVHLSAELLHEMRPLSKEGVFVFSRGRVPVADFSDAKSRLDQESGVVGWVFHDLRRTMTTRLAELGVPSAVVDALLNHKSGSAKSGVRGTYNRSELEPLRYRAINAWGRYVAFIIDQSLVAAWQEMVRAAEDEYDAKLEFGDAIRAGGTRWESFLTALRGGKGNVVAFREGAA
ncbi:integrase [Devosia sp. UYZn731]|uniref:tyrosine-type recombinase/integrase n=1 Tax=Devosia sp. UYZn731 TaxID=3156345 RepID=UPI003392DC1E